MGDIEIDIEKAIRRADFDLEAAIAATRDKQPRELTTEQARQERRAFLRESLRDAQLSEDTFERVLAGNELQPAAYLERGAVAARAVARIAVRTAAGQTLAWGTGFLIAPNVLLTNHHVLETREAAASSLGEFEYEVDLADMPKGPVQFRLLPDRLFHTSGELDFTIVAIEPRSRDGRRALAEFGWLPLLEVTGKAFEGEWLTIVQHPSGERKQLCVRENRLLKRADDVLWYTTDTQPGSSGSPVFNNDWYVVALHHSGVPETKNGVRQTIDGRDYDARTMRDSQLKWIANEGIRASRIVRTLRATFPAHPLLKPLFASTPASARIRSKPGAGAASATSNPPQEIRSMSDARTVAVPFTARFRIGSNGDVTPLDFEAAGGAESGAVNGEVGGAEAAFDLPFDADYDSRKGFQPAFLGNGAKRVDLPKLSPALKAAAVKLIGGTNVVLDYHNFSVVMHEERRFAIYSAANVNFAGRYAMSRPPDVWRVDPRIPSKPQVQNWYYASNQFDRGHLSRREDLEFGATRVAALHSAADTCHWTNCSPMHKRFNQGKEIWQGIERHVLEDSIERGSFSAQVITGPVFDDGDPAWKGIQYPLRFWKVVAALDASGSKLFATAYIASQEGVIAQYGLDEAAVPFAPFKTYQVRIEEVERLSGLEFTCGADGKADLRSHDPFTSRRRRRSGADGQEGLVAGAASTYSELESLSDIQL